MGYISQMAGKLGNKLRAIIHTDFLYPTALTRVDNAAPGTLVYTWADFTGFKNVNKNILYN